MRALTLKGSRFDVTTLPDPVPGDGKLLVRPLYTGICGSDLSLRKQMAEAEAAIPVDQRDDMLPAIVPGHEFSAEIVDIPSGTSTDLRVGDLITALPFTHDHEGPQCIGLSPVHSGGLASLSCVDAVRAFRVPDGVSADLAALAEPLAVGLHAANLASRNPGPNMVIGCGPVGLAVIMALSNAGRGPIIAADFSPERRKIAGELGADEVLDPKETSPYTHWQDAGFTPNPMSPLLDRAFSGRPSGMNVFECTGVQGVLGSIVTSAPAHSHIVVAGVCPHEDKLTPVEAITRELTIEFSFAYQPNEFHTALNSIRDHQTLAARFITSKRPLADTEAAFDALKSQPDEIKILINPQI